MKQIASIIYLHAITPVHSGTGSVADVIDLPVAREKATGYPMIPSSSLKGVLRSETSEEKRGALFGDKDSAGSLCLTDMRILCLPVRSYYGTFAWVTSPFSLTRLYRDAKAMGCTAKFLAVPIVGNTDILLTETSALEKDSKVYLDDLDFTAKTDTTTKLIARSFAEDIFKDDTDTFVSRFAIVSDNLFSFLCETGTEVAARIKLNEDTKTAPAGGLWYEESVPAESIFYGMALQNSGEEVSFPTVIQIGGDSSVGRGLCRLIIPNMEVKA